MIPTVKKPSHYSSFKLFTTTKVTAKFSVHTQLRVSKESKVIKTNYISVSNGKISSIGNRDTHKYSEVTSHQEGSHISTRSVELSES